MKKILITICCILAFIGVVVYNIQHEQKIHAGKFVVAVNMPLTGPSATYSGNEYKGLQMGIEDELTAQGLPLDSVVLDVKDNRSDATTGLSVLKLHEMKGFDAYFAGPTNVLDAVIPQLIKHNKPIFYRVWAQDVFDKGGQLGVRIYSNLRMESEAVFKFIEQTKAKRIIFFAGNLSLYNEQWKYFIEPYCQKHNLDCDKVFYNVTERDLRTIVMKVKEQNPDLVVAAGYGLSFYQAMINLYQQELFGKKVIAPTNYSALIVSSDEVSDKMKQSFYFIADDYTLPEGTPQKSTFIKRFKEKFGVYPVYNDAYAYDAGHLIVKAYAKKGKNVTTDDIVAETPYQGVTGHIVLDKENRDLISEHYIVHVNASGQIEKVDLGAIK